MVENLRSHPSIFGKSCSNIKAWILTDSSHIYELISAITLSKKIFKIESYVGIIYRYGWAAIRWV